MSNIRVFNNHFPQIGARVFIDPFAVVIGEVTLGDDVSIWPMVVIRGDVHRINIGASTNIQDGSILHVTHRNDADPDGGPLTIGQGVTVGHGAILHACDIGDYCLVGMGSTVLDKAQMEHHSMLGAGSVLPPGKIIKTGELWVGNPAKKVKDLSQSQRQSLEYSAKHYVKLKDTYQQQQTDG
ncbi:gamma carbonic anhydrase family protein [Marinicella sp. S1101]|uniref:gamma carbonic anhydrase family protein n=1 Tax=Marinicella marina TaxID=2996016 RepID=UPI002260F78A|nr:gamma carbonic anhydrase family protein [Marinicella marina]MCX7552867.1 gamma carbonic anhydrase family protein [Marinicella marina]MDJ1139824.1 gamma carbonic anhydrase family protein [Marinicella marina]